MYFNSSMMRLVVPNRAKYSKASYISIPVWCDWQSPVWRMISARNRYFNSSMVRLVAFDNDNQADNNAFQFQYGAIGSHEEMYCHIISCTFQFQYGAIGSDQEDWGHSIWLNFNSSMVRLVVGIAIAGFGISWLISIPVWCDWQWYRSTDINGAGTISIPVWCDWQYTLSGLGGQSQLKFQFQYGAIGRGVLSL